MNNIINDKSPIVIIPFYKGTFIDPYQETLFLKPTLSIQPMLQLRTFMNDYGISIEDIKRTIDYALYNNSNIISSRLVGPRLQTLGTNTMWKSFCNTVLSACEDIGEPFFDLDRDTSLVLTLISLNKINFDKLPRSIPLEFKDIMNRYSSDSAKFQKVGNIAVINSVIFDSVCSILESLPDVTVNYDKDFVRPEEFKDIFMKFLGLMVNEKLVPLNYRDKIIRSRLRHDYKGNLNILYFRATKYLNAYNSLTDTCKYLVYLSMRIMFRNSDAFIFEWLSKYSVETLLVKKISSVSNSRIADLVKVMIALDY